MEKTIPKMPELEGTYHKLTPKAKINEVLIGDIFIHIPTNTELIVNKTEVCYAGLDKREVHYIRFMTNQKSAGTAWTEDLLNPTKFQYVGHRE